MAEKNTALVLAAGRGRRMGGGRGKAFLSIMGKPLLAWTLSVFESFPRIQEVVLVVSPNREEEFKEKILLPYNVSKARIVSGGDSRQDSIQNGFAGIEEPCNLVVVHDGARPFISLMKIKECIETTAEKRATTVGIPVKETISEVSEVDSTVVKTIPRRFLYSIQTPQTFLKKVIVDAHRKALADGFQGTDDASLVQRLGVPVTVIMGSYENIKITTQEDLLLAKMFLKAGGGTDGKARIRGKEVG